ncbi:FkbM family methyltransferase [Seonamhaeicola sp. MEBiC1930]|uniref:FkbM family methyltransferase n=1 Tax=Seonamhaeicola sp. MEBiC01930 TaxID=2976768 RepID=UPI00324EC778
MTRYNRDNYIKSDTPLKSDLLKLFNKKDRLVILDIGGCEGEESIKYSRLFPFSTIFIFEPLPNNLELIKKHINKYQVNNVELIPFAVSNKKGISHFHVSSGHPKEQADDLDWDFGNKSSSLLQPNINNNPDWLDFNKKIDVETIMLKDFIIERNLKEIDFIHMDVQGAELKVLKGAKDYLENVKAIWLEVSNIELYKNQPLTTDVEVFMKSKGFTLVKSVFEGDFGDQFYVNKRYYKTFSFFNKSYQLYFKKSTKK